MPRFKCPRCGKRLRLPDALPADPDACDPDVARCWSCGRSGDPVTAREMGVVSWALVVVGAFFLPALLAGLLLRQEVTRCSDCGVALRWGRLAFVRDAGGWAAGVVAGGLALFLVAMLAIGGLLFFVYAR
jgi:hypothetical protein